MFATSTQLDYNNLLLLNEIKTYYEQIVIH